MSEQIMDHAYEEEELHEECGVFGAYSFDGEDVAPSVYYGLFASGTGELWYCGVRYRRTKGKGPVL